MGLGGLIGRFSGVCRVARRPRLCRAWYRNRPHRGPCDRPSFWECAAARLLRRRNHDGARGITLRGRRARRGRSGLAGELRHLRGDRVRGAAVSVRDMPAVEHMRRVGAAGVKKLLRTWPFCWADVLFVFVNAIPVIVGAWLIPYLRPTTASGPAWRARSVSSSSAPRRSADLSAASSPSRGISRLLLSTLGPALAAAGSSHSRSTGPTVSQRSGSSRSALASALPTPSRTSASRTRSRETPSSGSPWSPGRQLRRDPGHSGRGRGARARVRGAVVHSARRLLRPRRPRELHRAEQAEPRREHTRVVAGAADQLQRGGQPVLGRAARQRERGPTRVVEGPGEMGHPGAHRLVPGRPDLGSDEGQRRDDQEVEIPERLQRLLSVELARGGCLLAPLRRDREAVLDLVGDVCSVQVAVLREELAVHVGDLRHEARETPWAPGSRSRAGAGSVRRSPGCVRGRAGRIRRATRLRPSRRRALSSVGRNPGASTSIIAVQSPTVRAIGPTWSQLGASGKQPSSETRPYVGLKPTIPQHAAGMRIEPPESVPSAVSATRLRARRRTPARAAGDPPFAQRVRDGSEVRVLRRDPVGELVQVGLPDVRVAGGLEQADGLGGLRRDVVGEQRRAVRRRQSLRCRTGP